MPTRLIKGSLALLDRMLERVAFTWVYATRSIYLFFEHLHALKRR